MKSTLATRAFAALLSSPLLAAPAIAADATQISVALIDVSSVMGNGMMGMMSPGQGNWDNGNRRGGMGMMSSGQGNWDNWGNGMMPHGPGSWGNGMMGGGATGMGMMSVRLDQSTIKAGKVHFLVTNWSRAMVHEMLVVAVENPNAPLPYDYGAARIPEEQVKVLGEVDALSANGSGTLDLELSSGTYLLLCNVAGHYASGMVASLTVTP